MSIARGLGCALVLALAGCGTARHIDKQPGLGGVVAIPSNAEYHRKKAHELMAQNCPGGYEVVREEEVVVGQTTTVNHSTDSRRIDDEIKRGRKGVIPVSHEVTTGHQTHSVRDQTEVRLTYRARGN